MKGNIRSMRLSDECLQLIESQPGESFTAKFEYLVHYCINKLPDTERHLNHLRELIRDEDLRLTRIRKKASELESCINGLQNNLQYVTRQSNQVISNLDSLINDS